ncbi:MAG: pseudomurein-binding protein [Methanosphaera sp.]|nr:pseudomurein-binding protein [Methanosphaera sp.]
MKRVIKKELTEKEYSKFIKELLAINEKKGHLPEYIEFDDCRIFKIEYIETIENVNKFILENGRHPESISIYQQKHNRHSS